MFKCASFSLGRSYKIKDNPKFSHHWIHNMCCREKTLIVFNESAELKRSKKNIFIFNFRQDLRSKKGIFQTTSSYHETLVNKVKIQKKKIFNPNKWGRPFLFNQFFITQFSHTEPTLNIFQNTTQNIRFLDLKKTCCIIFSIKNHITRFIFFLCYTIIHDCSLYLFIFLIPGMK